MSLRRILGGAVIFLLLLPGLAEATDVSHEGLKALRLGWKAYQRGEYTEALEHYQTALKSAPADASLWYDVGCLYALTHHLTQAREAFSKAIQVDPSFASAYDALGQVLEQEGHTTQAVEYYAQATFLKPSHAPFLRNLARGNLRLEHFEETRTALQHLLAIEATDVNARYTMGVLELRQNMPDLAVSEFLKILEQEPRHIMARNGLALAYTRMGLFDAAAHELEEAQRLDPQNPRTRTNQGILAAAQNHWDEAKEAWEKALQIDHSFGPARENLKILNTQESPSP